jgi:hypothetical protein
MKKLNLFAIVSILSLVVSACGGYDGHDDISATSTNRVTAPPQSEEFDMTASSESEEEVSSDEDNITPSEPTCDVIKNTILGEGYAPRFAMNDDGYAILWTGGDRLPRFQSFDWSGISTSDETILVGATNFVGGRDDYLVAFKDDASTGNRYSIVGTDGREKVAIENDFRSATGAKIGLSFDGTYYRLTWVYTNEMMGGAFFLGCDGSEQYAFFSGRISVDGDIVLDQRSSAVATCVNGTIGKDSQISRIVETEDELPLVYLWNSNAEMDEGSGKILIDLNNGSSWKPLDSEGNAYDIAMSDEGLVAKWRADGQFISVLADNHVDQTFKMPNGMQPNVIDGNEIVDIMRDDLAESDMIIRTTLHGKEILRQEMESSPVEVNCYRDLYGRDGIYVNLGSTCSPTEDETALVTMRVITCN